VASGQDKVSASAVGRTAGVLVACPPKDGAPEPGTLQAASNSTIVSRIVIKNSFFIWFLSYTEMEVAPKILAYYNGLHPVVLWHN
jgi:hypothetical protein